MEQEFQNIDSSGGWQNLYNEIRNLASEHPYKVAKFPENKNLNRYRDVSPYDHSRVKLKDSENDYINASLVTEEEAQRSYILSQGPLCYTCGHFWLMIWEQRSKAVIMLNRVIEKGSEKCAQYWPTKEESQMSFADTGFDVKLLSEEDQSYFTVRVLELHNTKTMERREIYHFHYTTWPDFGVPESPASFLNFLFKVRESGSLSTEHGPPVVHCSAGIGRSGTFALVDTCLVLESMLQNLLKEELEPEPAPPPPPPRPNLNDSRQPNGPCLDSPRDTGDLLTTIKPGSQDPHAADGDMHVRKRHREERIANTAQKVQQIKQRLTDSEKKQEKWQCWKPVLLNVGVGAAVVAGLLCFLYFQ
uniref:Tyrosine-protein phosphatase non-receptor type n=1 Tax=Oryzias melastigma TaxID=30732 RepID=A0A3B3BJR2_ORYME